MDRGDVKLMHDQLAQVAVSWEFEQDIIDRACDMLLELADENAKLQAELTAIKAQSEPFGYVTHSGMSAYINAGLNLDDGTPLYLHPVVSHPSEDAKWQPIETAPKDGPRLLIVNADGQIDVAGYVEQWHERSEFVRKAKDGDVFRTVREDIGYWDTNNAPCPTHWMPLPALPAMQEEK